MAATVFGLWPVTVREMPHARRQREGTAILHHRGLDRTEKPAMPAGMTGSVSGLIHHGHMRSRIRSQMIAQMRCQMRCHMAVAKAGLRRAEASR
ncbi:hypothetical protein AOG28_15205 [Cobetia sp. UCD-24C]|nr:hypothetical protein AOG28_15205 [Cobetia sp. UCD-24C]